MPISSEDFNNYIDEHRRLVDIISDHFGKMEHSIHQGVKIGRFIADVIAVRDENQIIAIEVKKDDTSARGARAEDHIPRKGLHQSISPLS